MPTPWIALRPITCEIGYDEGNVGNEEFYAKIDEAHPGLLHIGHDVPFSTWMGPVEMHGLIESDFFEPDEILQRIEDLRRHVTRLRESGAREIAPYLCTMLCCGNPDTRAGWWRLLDRWEDYAHFGLGEKPDTDPADWNQAPKHPFPDDDTHFAYEPSIGHPAWRRFLLTCADLVAQCGYDGTFLDVNAYAGTLEEDRQAFAAYLRERYTSDRMGELFGFADDANVRFGEEPGSLLLAETYRFRAVMMGRLFAEIRDAGRVDNPDFWVYPNNTPLCTVEAYYSRRNVGHQLGYLHESCKYLMFEDMQQPGRFGADRIWDHILHYRYALAHGARSTVLPYHANDDAGITLANAECAANGGAMYVQPGYNRREKVRFWTGWFDDHAALYDGMRSVHDVGVLYFADEMFWESREHIDAVFRVRQALSDRHILYDFVVEPNFTDEALASFSVVIVPLVSHLSDDQIAALQRYVDAGGALLIVGECGTHSELGEQRDASSADLVRGGATAANLDDLVPRRAPESFDLSEDEINDYDHIVGLPDRVGSAEEAQAARDVPLIGELERLAGRRLRALADGAPYTLRMSMFEDPTGDRRVAHLVNYDLPVVGRGKSEAPIPARDVTVLTSAESAVYWTPEGVSGERLAVDGDGIHVPEVHSYALIEIAGNDSP